MEGSSRLAVLQTKTILPHRPDHLLTRQRLINLLYDIFDYRLFILTAPAGYGKTSILVDWANQAELPVCWYTLDSLDRDPHRFFSYFVNALSKKFPDFGHTSQLAMQNMTRNLDIQRLVHIVVNDAFDHIQDQFALIIDDYHVIENNTDINTFLSLFVQQVDENCHVVLASRNLLSLPDMPLMVARSQAAGIGFEELAFQAHEIQELAQQNYELTLALSEAETIVQETEGWITGVLLSSQPKWQGKADRIKGILSTGAELHDYMAQQVLDKQPQILRDFLLRTSLLEEFDAALCCDVLGAGTDCQMLMNMVQQNNLFVLSVGVDGKWLRYHHLFLQFLQMRMEQDHPAEFHVILRRLAEVYAEQESWDKAYEIYQRLGDIEATAEFIDTVGESMVKQGRTAVLNQWLDELPYEKLTVHPSLLSRHGMAAVMNGQNELGLKRLNRAAEMLTSINDYEHLIGCLVWRATAHRFLGDYQAANTDADQALALFRQYGGRLELWAAALRIKGLALYWQGHLGEAISWLKRSLMSYIELSNKQYEALLLIELGLVTMGTGAYEQALQYYTKALPFWLQGYDPVRQATLLNNIGVLYHLMGDYEQAASTLEQAVTIAHDCEYVRMEALAYASLGDLYLDLDAFEAANEAYQQVKPLAHQMADRFLLLYLNIAQAVLAEVQGSVSQAKLYLDEAWAYTQGGSSDYEFGLWYFAAGCLAFNCDDFTQAIDYFHQASDRFDLGGQQAENARTHLYLAIIAALQNQKRNAELHIARAFFLSSEVQSQNLLVLAGYRVKSRLQKITISPIVDTQIRDLLDQIVIWESQIPALRRRLRRRSTAVNFAPSRLTMHALGEPHVYLNKKEVTNTQWQSLAARNMLFCLLAHPEGLSGENLGLLFWPDKTPPKLKLHLKKTLYRLRRALQQNAVVFMHNRYTFNYALDYEYDVEEFWQNIEKGQNAQSIINQVDGYRQAVELYRGSFLSDIDGLWIIGLRERIWQAFRKAALFLADHYLNISSFETALNYCHRILDFDSCIEEAHAIAMRIYALQGDNAEVAMQFERCKRSLLDELGVQPSPQTQALFQQLTRSYSTR